MRSTEYAIEVENLAKAFGRIKAVAGVSFTVPKGSVYCILGPNGAGKTTLLRILTTITRADSGQAYIEGRNIVSDVLAVRSLIGVVAQENHFDRYLSIWHNLTMHAQMHGMAKDDYEPRITELLEKVDLYDRRFSLADDLSGGMQRRVALIRALIHQPRVLFLDEPSTGLDPQARLEIWETIEQFKQYSTVILTTHYMEEADRLSDQILMINQGKVVIQGTPRELKQRITPSDNYELVLNKPKAQEYKALFEAMAPQHDIRQVKTPDDYTVELQMSHAKTIQDVFCAVGTDDLLRIGRKEADLEDVFMSVAQKNNKAETGGAS